MQTELYNWYVAKYYAFCRQYATDDDNARDILTDSFLKVYESLDKFKGVGSFDGWVHRITIRHVLDYLKKSTKYRICTLDDEYAAELANDEDFESVFEKRDLLLKAMSGIPDDDIKLIKLVAAEDYTLKECAEMYRVPESTLKSKYYRIIARIRQNLKTNKWI